MTRRSKNCRLIGEKLEDRQLLVVPDFQLVDDNSKSPSYGETISPRDYLQQVSGWYFIHST